MCGRVQTSYILLLSAKGQLEPGADGGPSDRLVLLEVQSLRVGHTPSAPCGRSGAATAPEGGQSARHVDAAAHKLLVRTTHALCVDPHASLGHYSAVPRRFLDHDAFLFGFVFPVLVLLVTVIVFLVRGAVTARFTVSMQVDRRARDKMRRKRRLQLFLFLKVTALISTVAALGALAKLTGKHRPRRVTVATIGTLHL